MVKSQLRSLAKKSQALNAKINDETKIDEWAESYITRADAQIDDVSDYMNFRNLGGLNKRMGHVLMKPKPSRALPAPKLPIYGQQRQPALPAPPKDRDGDGVPDDQDKYPDDPTEWADLDNDGVPDNFDDFGAATDYLPEVTGGSTFGAVAMTGLVGATLGLITYNEYRSKRNVRQVLVPRLKRAAVFAATGSALALGYSVIVGTGQKTGLY